MMRTWQTRIKLGANSVEDRVLSEFSELYGKIERKLFSEISANHGKSLVDIKREYIAKYRITARQFNAIRIGLMGKISAIQELRAQYITDTEARIAKNEKTLKSLEKKLKKLKAKKPPKKKISNPPKDMDKSRLRYSIHQKKRHLGALNAKLERLKAADGDNKVRICFGSNALFRQQFNLEANGLKDQDEWKAKWKKSRNNQFSLVGSKDETAGNVSCQLSQQIDGLYRLKIRLPDAMQAHGKFLELIDVKLPYGKDKIQAALALNTAISYRFIKDDKDWRVLISSDIKEQPKKSKSELGWIGVDINADHLAVTETDCHGNPVDCWRIPLNTYGKTSEQAKAIVGDAVKVFIKIAEERSKPIAIERLDFARKKTDLAQENNRKYARMLSSFAYSQIINTIKARAFDAGIDVKAVNPAYSSLIGQYKFAKRYGITKHQAAACVIARRAENHSERPNAVVFTDNALSLPVRNRNEHVWVFWRKVLKEIRAHAARTKRARGPSDHLKTTRKGSGDMAETILRNSGAIPEPNASTLFGGGMDTLEQEFAKVPF